MLHDEYPHTVAILRKVSIGKNAIGGKVHSWEPYKVLSALVDTPSSRERFTAMQVENPVDRNMYFPYRTDILADMRCLFDGDHYDLTGKPEDQGGQREVMKVGLRLVRESINHG